MNVVFKYVNFNSSLYFWRRFEKVLLSTTVSGISEAFIMISFEFQLNFKGVKNKKIKQISS